MISQCQRSSIACYLGNYTAIGFSVSDNEINEKSREVNYYSGVQSYEVQCHEL